MAAVLVFGAGTALLAARSRLGQIAMTLSLPLVGVGLSFGDVGQAAGAAGYSLAAVAAVAGAAGTHRSRWYVTSAFTTFVVFLLLLYSDPGSAGARFDERVVETLLGVGLAYVFGLALPAVGLSFEASPGSRPGGDDRA